MIKVNRLEKKKNKGMKELYIYNLSECTFEELRLTSQRCNRSDGRCRMASTEYKRRKREKRIEGNMKVERN